MNIQAVEDESKKPKLKLPPLPNPKASGLPSKLPPGLAPNEDSLLSDWLYAHQIQKVIQSTYPIDKYTIPATTTQEIGWAWKNVQNNLGLGSRPLGPVSLERYGNYARGRGDVMKWFGGCRESLP
jgi:hypothetical protein